MSTTLDTTLYASNSTDAMFRAWASFIHSVFALGLTNTADTGQINLATVTKPSVASASQGYKMYRTNDGLTNVYIKCEFGCTSNVLYPSLWITIGTGTDGAGTINGTVLMARTQLYTGASDTTNQHLCFGSAANNRVCFGMFLSVTSTTAFWFSLERRKTSALADADTGIIIDSGRGSAGHMSLCAPFTGVIPTPETGLQFILTTNNPGVYGNTIPEALRIPCLGPSEPPGLNVAICNVNDYGAFAEVTININGVNRAYKHCGANINSLRGMSTGVGDANTRLMLRYE
ncbi:MAG: hypothetical protein P9F75_00700 [Candidatus Contendobacter sp.]|nr:hypothetical protein [Candidatus Contendobacter sp.]